MIETTPHPSQDLGDTIRSIGDRNKKALLDQYLGSDFTGTAPTVTILEQKPVHTTMAYLLAAGRTRMEIAGVLNLSLASISQIVRQPWFQKQLKEITEANGKDMVKSFLEGEVLPSLEVLRTIRDDSSQKGPTRVMASNSILDRFLGKPMVHVESKTNLNIHTAAESVEQVERELRSVNEELLTRGVKLSGTN